MMRVLKLTFLVTVVLLDFAGVIAAQNQGSQAYGKISRILKADEVGTISIIHVPNDLETRTRIDQQALRRLTRINLSFQKPQEEGIIPPLQMALEELKIAKPSTVHEIRWGILFLDRSGKELAAMFLDPSGQFVQLEDTNLQVQGKTLVWLNKAIHNALR